MSSKVFARKLQAKISFDCMLDNRLHSMFISFEAAVERHLLTLKKVVSYRYHCITNVNDYSFGFGVRFYFEEARPY